MTRFVSMEILWRPFLLARKSRKRPWACAVILPLCHQTPLNITRSQPRCSRQCVAQYLFELALWKKNKTFSLTLILWKKHKNVKIEIWFIVVCTLIDNEYTSYLFSQTIFKYWFCMLSEFAKVFERKIWLIQVAHLHNEACSRSGGTFLEAPGNYWAL